MGAQVDAPAQEPEDSAAEEASPAAEPQTEPQPSKAAPKTKAAPTQQQAIEPRTPGRLKVAFKLIGMGMRELFTGRISRDARQRGRRG